MPFEFGGPGIGRVLAQHPLAPRRPQPLPLLRRDFGQDPQTAIDTPHVLNRNAKSQVEAGEGAEAMIADLATLGDEAEATDLNSGLHAILIRDGTLTGWIGGSCAQPTVVKAALGVALLLAGLHAFRAAQTHASGVSVALKLFMPVAFAAGALFAIRAGVQSFREAREIMATPLVRDADEDDGNDRPDQT